MDFAVLGLGTAVPSLKVTQEQSIRAAQAICCRNEKQAAWAATLAAHTGIEQRHLALPPQVVSDVLHGTRFSDSIFLPSGAEDDRGPTTGQRMRFYAETAPSLALDAAGEALARSGLSPGDITHLITVSCTGFAAPGIDFELIDGLRLPPTTQRTHVGFMGCHAALNGLRVARAFANDGTAARVLLCAVELCVLHYHYGWEPEKMIANALFADGAAALVGAPAACAPPDAWRVAAAGSSLLPDSRQAMTWNVGDHGFVMTLSADVPTLIAKHLRPWLESWLDVQGLTIGEVGSWAVHPGGPRILEAAEEALGLDREDTKTSRQILAEYGNMSSPTVLFILERLRQHRARRPCVAMAFGPGLAVEAVLFR